MSYTIWIRHNLTREVRLIAQPFTWEEGSYYWWTEGNFGCDCNRALEFARARGEEPPEPLSCGEAQFTAIKAVLEDGTEILLD